MEFTIDDEMENRYTKTLQADDFIRIERKKNEQTFFSKIQKMTRRHFTEKLEKETTIMS